jgi:hypothetical protein
MRLLLTLALIMLPLTMVQYSTDSHALESKATQQEVFLDKTASSRKQGSDINVSFDDGDNSDKSFVSQATDTQAKNHVEPPSRSKKVKIVEGKRNTQGMQLLNVLLMLKEKSR